MLFVGLALALIHPASQPGVFAADKDTGTISGSVVVEGGGGPKPVANAEVRLTFGSKAETRRTGADGKYVFVELLSGQYTVKVTAPEGMKPKGDGIAAVSLAGGEVERADFVLTTMATPTPSPAPKTTASPASLPASGQAGQAPPKPAQNQQAASSGGVMPALVIPYASPSPSPVSVQARTAPQQSSDPASLASSIGVSSTPSPVVSGTPGLLFAAASPTPVPSPTGTWTPTAGEEVLANGPPRRLITSFEALRDTGNGASAAQLKSWATETSLVLGVPFRSQIDGTTFSLVNCGPASLAMVLIAFGLDVDPPSVRDYLNFLVGNYDSEQGTSLYVLARIAREAGLSTFGTSSGLQGWNVEAVRDQVRAGHPVITLTKYRLLPGHFGSVTDFDHYIVITGLAGEDFVYNDAAYSTEYGYNLLISPSQLERAWAASSVPRHAVAIGFGDSLRPLPIVPRRLTAESLAADAPNEDVQLTVETPIRVNRGPAAEWLREQTLELLGARSMLVSSEPTTQLARMVPPTRIDPSEAGVLERPAGTVLSRSEEYEWASSAVDAEAAVAADDGTVAAAVVADGRTASQASAPASRVVGTGRVEFDDAGGILGSPLTPLGMALMSLGLLLMVGGGLAGWRRREPATVLVGKWAGRLPARVRLDRVVRRAIRAGRNRLP